MEISLRFVVQIQEVNLSVDFQLFCFDLCCFARLREVRFGCVYVGRDNFRFILIERVIRVCSTYLFVLRSRFHLSVKTNNSRCIW